MRQLDQSAFNRKCPACNHSEIAIVVPDLEGRTDVKCQTCGQVIGYAENRNGEVTIYGRSGPRTYADVPMRFNGG